MATTSHGVGGLTFDSKKRTLPPEAGVFIALIVITIIFEVLNRLNGSSFLFNVNDKLDLLFNKQRLDIMILQVAIIGIISLGVTQVIIIGGIDLSSGSVVGATAMIVMSFAQTALVNGNPNPKAIFGDWAMDLPVIAPIAAGVACGLFAGLVNGLLIAYTKIPPFIATLGMMVSARGVARWWSNGNPVSFPTEGYAHLSNGDVVGTLTFGLIHWQGQNPAIVFIALAILFHLIMRYTLYGKRSYAIGSNEAAARMSGINVARHKLLVYTIAGMLAAVAAILLTSKNLTAQAGMGSMYELDAIAMAVIGGVSLSGGRGSIVGTVIGALIFSVIISGFTSIRLDAYYQDMVKGAIIVGAVVLDQWRQRRAAMGSRAASMVDTILETKNLTKHYGGVHALEGANFILSKGEHVAIVGDNGAGKSTFVRQITGVEQPTSGTIWFDGKDVAFENPLRAREAGIETVFQNLALADDLDVPSNLFLGRERIRWNLGPFSILDRRAMRDATIKALKKTAVKIPNLSNTIRNMSGGQRQCVAIARTATFASKMIIMDEPTAALGVQETAQVENIIRTLKQQGESLILISHNMRQVFDLVDRIVVFRRGLIVANLNKEESSARDIVAYITGAKTGLVAEPALV